MPGAAFNAASAVHAVGIAELVVLGITWREEAEGARLGAKSAFHAGIGDAEAVLQRPNRLVDLPHRADGTPEVAIEYQPPDDTYRGRDGDHDVQQHPPGTERRRAEPLSQPREHRHYHHDGEVLLQQGWRYFASRIGQQ